MHAYLHTISFTTCSSCRQACLRAGVDPVTYRAPGLACRYALRRVGAWPGGVRWIEQQAAGHHFIDGRDSAMHFRPSLGYSSLAALPLARSLRRRGCGSERGAH